MDESRPQSPVKSRCRCLRCGAEFELELTPGKVEEKTCPECESNSVRPLKPGPDESAGREPD